jgi:hypothetical protein
MPLLPDKNSLDYNPDSIINASKKIASISLERMKNPIEDPDFATLSNLNANKNLDNVVNILESLAGKYHSIVLRLSNILSGKKTGGKIKKLKGGAEPELRDPQDILRELSRNLGRPRNVQNRRLIRDDDIESSNTGSSSEPSRFRARRLERDSDDQSSESSRFTDFYQDDDLNSSATTYSTFYPDEEDEVSSFGEFESPQKSRFTVVEPSRVTEDRKSNFNSLIFPLIQLTREMNMIINSKIRPVINYLTSLQIKKLNSIYQMVKSSYNDVLFPKIRRERKVDPFTNVVNPKVQPRTQTALADDVEFAILESNQFGDEILNTWNTERNNLLINLTVVVNSWKQNTPTGQQTELGERLAKSYQDVANRLGTKAELTEYAPFYPDDGVSQGAGRKKPKKDTMNATLLGSGNNFYGEKINNSRDIPTIYGSMKNCATKYLL